MQLAEELQLLQEDCEEHLFSRVYAEALASALVWYRNQQEQSAKLQLNKVENNHKVWHVQQVWPGMKREDIMFLLTAP